jgi:spermidine/putrescine transport system permease protein
MSAVAEAPPRPSIEPAPVRKPTKRWTRFILPVFTGGMMVYLVLPILLMIVYGFNDIPGERQTSKFFGLTLNWWRPSVLFGDPALVDSIRNSVIVAPISALIATILGTLVGLALGRYVFRGRAPINFIIFLGIAVPEIVLGASMLSMFVQVEFPLGINSILLAHISFSIPFVAVTVGARVSGLDRSLENAAQDLFATPIVAFFRVTLPLIFPGILAGFFLAFVLSLDDFVITNFVSGPENTFPTWVYGATRIGVPPTVNVMGTILFAAGLVLAGLQLTLAARARRKERLGAST